MTSTPSHTRDTTSQTGANEDDQTNGSVCPKLDFFGLAKAGPSDPPLRFPHTAALFTALIRAENRGAAVHASLQRALDHTSRWESDADWQGLDYFEPPDDEDDPELKSAIEQRRRANPPHFRETIRIFDAYHQARLVMWRAVAAAKTAAEKAQRELDIGTTAPLDLPTVHIHKALDRLRCAVRTPFMDGPYPTMHTPEDLDALGRAVQEIHGWVERLRPLAGQRLDASRPIPSGEVSPAPADPSESPASPAGAKDRARVVQVGPVPPPGFVATSGILREDGSQVPPSTIASWRERHECETWVHPGTREIYHPEEWVRARLRSHRPGRHPPSK